MRTFDFTVIIKKAWASYNPSREIKYITDVSAKVSTNHVYKIVFTDGSVIMTKLSFYGKFESFKEDHAIINVLANNLEAPYENFLAHSLIKGNELYTYKYQDQLVDVWVVFYRTIKIKDKLPRRLEENQIIKMGQELAQFHKACYLMKDVLPASSKTLETDIHSLYRRLERGKGKYGDEAVETEIKRQCDIFMANAQALEWQHLDRIPVFVDWNIGNFSVRSDYSFYSRWDYDWFRIDTRMMDFYFFSRVVSNIGDRTIFSYTVDQLMEDRFILFLKAYHQVYPLTANEILFLKEAYRFFILNYVIKDGKYFFHEIYATKLQKEAFEIYFPALDKTFNADTLLKALDL